LPKNLCRGIPFEKKLRQNNSQNHSQTHCNIGSSVSENAQMKSELEKQLAVNEQQAQEILYLRELVDSFVKNKD
jgi:hypothetical protein